jgi:hypothetical protein
VLQQTSEPEKVAAHFMIAAKALPLNVKTTPRC